MRSFVFPTACLFLGLLFAQTSCTQHQGATSVPKNNAEALHTHDENPARIYVINDSAAPIEGIYVAPTGRAHSTKNFLEGQQLAVGHQVEISSVQQGTWDIHIEDRTGRTRTYTDQHLRGGEPYHLIIDAYQWH